MADVAARRVAQAAFAVAAAAMVATPLAPRGGGRRAWLANVVVSGLATTTAALAARRWGTKRAMVATATTMLGTGLLEHVGTSTARPFGPYRYTGALRPAVAGVPIVVPMAWHAMALPSREVAHGLLGPRSSSAGRVALGGLALTAWDLFLDPQMTAEGYWRWCRPGRYRGIPATNFVGWLVTSLGVMSLLEVVLPVDGGRLGADVSEGAIGVYLWMAVMQTVGFALFFHDPLVAVVGGAAMVPLAVGAAVRARAAGG